jgi:hypothetical protein
VHDGSSRLFENRCEQQRVPTGLRRLSPSPSPLGPTPGRRAAPCLGRNSAPLQGPRARCAKRLPDADHCGEPPSWAFRGMSGMRRSRRWRGQYSNCAQPGSSGRDRRPDPALVAGVLSDISLGLTVRGGTGGTRERALPHRWHLPADSSSTPTGRQGDTRSPRGLPHARGLHEVSSACIGYPNHSLSLPHQRGVTDLWMV